MDRPVRVVCLRGRTSDRTDGPGAGAEALARRLGGRVVGEPEPGRVRPWDEDLAAERPVLKAAAQEVATALDAGALPLLTAGHCDLCMTTLPAVANRVPDVRFAWFDAHGDFNTPATTESGFLGGMCLAAACGRWDAGWPATIDQTRVSFVGVRDLDPAERPLTEGIGRGVPETGPVYVHLDLDVLDPSVMAAQFPAPGGLRPDEVRDALAVLGDRLVGIEVTALEDPAAVELVAGILEPVWRR